MDLYSDNAFIRLAILLQSTMILMNELEDAERVLSKRLLDFRRAMGSGSADTIRQSLRADLI